MVCEWGGERCVYNTPRWLGVMRRGPIEIAAPAGAYFAGKKSNKREAGPLAKAERLQELLFGVMESRVDNVNGRDRQGHPAENSYSL